MGDYRFNPAKGFRRRGQPYNGMENIEFDSEKYDDIEAWFDHIKHYFLIMLESDEEEEIEREGGDDES